MNAEHGRSVWSWMEIILSRKSFFKAYGYTEKGTFCIYHNTALQIFPPTLRKGNIGIYEYCEWPEIYVKS